MKTKSYSGKIEVVAANLEPGENLLGSIRKIISEHDIKNGVIVSGVATLKKTHMHHIEHTDFPPDNTFYTLDKPVEVGSISGIIASGEPHLHMTVGYRDEATWVGHVEEDCIVGYLAEICILKFNGLQMARHLNDKKKTKTLGF